MSCLWIHSKSVAEPVQGLQDHSVSSGHCLSFFLLVNLLLLETIHLFSLEESSQSFSNRNAPAQVRVMVQLLCHFLFIFDMDEHLK